MTLLEHAQARSKAAPSHPTQVSLTHTLHRMYPPLPTGHSRLRTYLTFIDNSQTSALLDCTRDARCGLTLGDPWLPDGVPVLILDGLPIIASTRQRPSVAIIHPTNPVPPGVPSTAEELHVMLGAGAPIPHPITAVEDLATIIKQGRPYLPVLNPTFRPDLQNVLRVNRAATIDAVCFPVLFLTVGFASAAPLFNVLGTISTDKSLGTGLLVGACMLIGFPAVLFLLAHIMQAPFQWRSTRRTRQLGL